MIYSKIKDTVKSESNMNSYKQFVRYHCVRGSTHFCDGTYNGVKGVNIGPCVCYINGGCSLIKEILKNDS